MYVAVLRKFGGSFVKTARRQSSPLFFPDTSFSNTVRPPELASPTFPLHTRAPNPPHDLTHPPVLWQSTFFREWPKSRGAYIMYGRSAHTQREVVQQALIIDQRPADEAAAPRRRSFLDAIAEPVQPPVPAAKKPPAKVNLRVLRQKHAHGEPLSMLTAYDYPSARLGDAAGADLLLVGDSLGMVVLGQEDTTEVTMDQMVHHCAAVARGSSRSLLVGDLPFGSCLTADEAARNGVRLIKEGRVDAVKLEGGERMLPQVRALVDAGVAVMGHLGLTPQSYAQLGGFCVQGRSATEAMALLHEAKMLQEAGCFAIVLEMVPAPVAAEVTRQLAVPTIGIGAGGGCAGQVQVFHDVLGLYDKKVPHFSRQFARLEAPMTAALREYVDAVKLGAFPQPKHAFKMPPDEQRAFEAAARADSPDGADGADTKTKTAAAPSTEAAQRAAAVAAVAAVAVAPSRARVVRTIEEWRNLQAEGVLPRGAPLGLVPTMGALHDGHLSLVRRARKQDDFVAASVFVNPAQFAPHEDLATYPRPWEADLAALDKCGVDFVFAPSPDEMYPRGKGALLSTHVDLLGVDGVGEGASRPGFFRGVVTVVSKLLNIVQPTRVYFGQKDGLQCVAINRLIEDLNFNTQLVVGETVREADGLAMSSRNVYLDGTQRAAAPAVYAALCQLRDLHAKGERGPEALRAAAAAVIAREPLMALEYVSLASTVDGQEVAQPLLPAGEATLVSIAVRVGKTRLIDNVLLM